MRLAIIRRRYNSYGGAERFIERLIPALVKHGVQTTIISENWKTARNMPIQFVQVESSGWSRSAKFKSFSNHVAAVLQGSRFETAKIDLVQSHERLVGADIYRAGDGVHAAWLERLRDEGGRLRSWWLSMDAYHRSVIETELAMASDNKLHYIANSEMIRDELQRLLSIKSDRIDVIPNGVNTMKFAPRSVEDKIKARQFLSRAHGLQIPHTSNIIAFVGSGFKRKGVHKLIEALPQLGDTYLMICGHDKNINQTKRCIARLGLESKVILTGPMIDVRPLLWAADVFALPSLYDPSSNAVLEAMACGLPVVITRDVGMSEEIVLSGAGVLCTRDKESIAEALNLALVERVNCLMAQNARGIALRYSQDLIIKSWLELYRRFI